VGEAALAQPSSDDWIHFVCLTECCLIPAGALGREMLGFHDLICAVDTDQ